LKSKTGPVVWRVTIRYFDHKEGLQEQRFTVETAHVDGLAATRLALEMLETDRRTFGASDPINTLELYCSLTSDV